MNCKNCGGLLDAGAKFCKKCGAAVNLNEQSDNQATEANYTPKAPNQSFINYSDQGNAQQSNFTNGTGVTSSAPKVPNQSFINYSDQGNAQQSNFTNGTGVASSAPKVPNQNATNYSNQGNTQQSSFTNETGVTNSIPKAPSQNAANYSSQSSVQQDSFSSQAFNQNSIDTQSNYSTLSQFNLNQTVQNNNNTEFMPKDVKQNSKKNMICLIIDIVVVLGVIIGGLLVARTFFNNFMNNIMTIINNQIPIVDEGTSTPIIEDETPIDGYETYNVTFQGFKFDLPKGCAFEIDDDLLTIGDLEQTWAAQITLDLGSYLIIKDNMSELKSEFESEGYISTNPVEKRIGNLNFITLELTSEDFNGIYAITEISSTYYATLYAFNSNNGFDYSILSLIEPIISSATYVGTSSNTESNINSDFSVLKKIIK